MIQKLICFFIGFVAMVSVVVMDDRMAMNYGRESALDVHEEVRLLVSEVENHLYKWEKNVL